MVLNEKVSIAPMMEWTDRHYRMLMRGITRKTVLYTEMVVDETLMYNPNLDIFVGRYIDEDPSVIQLGGSDPECLANAAEMCSKYLGNYGEINLNCGCPSERVSKKCFGAKLMLNPDNIRKIVYEMSRKSVCPITVKCRIGVDNQDSYDDLKKFIECAHAGGANKFIVHSRKCLLTGLTTKQNRDIPPLKYEVVHRLVSEYPDLQFVLNGGITSLQSASSHMSEKYLFENEELPPVHGVMIGRAAYNNPCMLATVDSMFYGVKDPCLSRRAILERYINYCEWAQSEEGPTRIVRNGTKQCASTMILINAMRNVVNGMKQCNAFRKALNDIYMHEIQGHALPFNPDPRVIVSVKYVVLCMNNRLWFSYLIQIEGAMEVLDPTELDAPLGRSPDEDEHEKN